MNLTRREYSQVLAAADRQSVIGLCRMIEQSHTVRSLRPAQKTLAMIRMREPISASLFYLGEALCCECMVEVERTTGFAVILGDDFEKVTAAAVVDAALTADLPEAEALREEICQLQQKQRQARAGLNAEIRKSRVEFSAMGEA